MNTNDTYVIHLHTHRTRKGLCVQVQESVHVVTSHVNVLHVPVARHWSHGSTVLIRVHGQLDGQTISSTGWSNVLVLINLFANAVSEHFLQLLVELFLIPLHMAILT